eukprot:2222265-Amphidinium_carterae.1
MDLAEAHNILDRDALRARGFADTEELLLPLPCSDSDSPHSEPSACRGSFGTVPEPQVEEAAQLTMPQVLTSVYVDNAVVREVAEGALGMQIFPSSRVLLQWLLRDDSAPSLSGA